MKQEIFDKIQKLSASEQQKIIDLVEKLLAEQTYQEKIATLQKAKEDKLFQEDLKNMAEDFKHLDTEW